MRAPVDTLFAVVDRLSPVLAAPLCPVFALNNATRPVPIASAVLLALGPRRFILTASHVAATRFQCALGVGLGNQLLPLAGEWYSTSRTDDDQSDRLDLAILDPDPSILEAINASQAVPLGKIASLPPSREIATVTAGCFLTMGFPVSIQPRRVTDGTYTSNVWRLISAGEDPDHYGLAKAERDRHLLLEFDKANVFTPRGAEIPPDPVGASGGAVWWIRVTEHGPDPRLVAIPVLWRQGASQILATRLFVALAGICQHFPDLRGILDAAD